MNSSQSAPTVLIVGEALDALAENKLRTCLSLIGVAIGVAAVILVSSLSASARDMVYGELETFGLRTFWIYRKFLPGERFEKDASGTGINNSDVRYLKTLEGVEFSKIAPVVEFASDSPIASNGAYSSRVRLQGVVPELSEINQDLVAMGRFITSDDVRQRRKVTVLGPGAAEKIFPDEPVPLGRRCLVQDTWFEVVGVMERKSRDLITSLGAAKGEEAGDRMLIPISTRQQIAGGVDTVSYIQGQALTMESPDASIKRVSEILRGRHGNHIGYAGESMATYVATANRILGGMAFVGVLGAIVSLVVGGLAIMNIMTTSVIERTREIGIRIAIGASRADIRTQFLTEAIAISCIGGAAGIFLGVALVQVISLFTGFPVALSYVGVAFSAVCTVSVGLASGYMPANSASRLTPVDALRHA